MDKDVIIAGAGISVDSPSNFPVAIPIINSIVSSITTDDFIKNELLRNDLRVDIGHEYQLSGDFLRFEMLMNAISLIDKDLSVLDAIKNYKNPNLNHYNLAKLAIEGHYVFTPNFDDLIERAICDMGYVPKTICTKHDYESFSFLDKKTVPVFKLHGSYYRYLGSERKKVKSKKTLQASLTSIVSGNRLLMLDSFKTKILGKSIQNASKLIFVGYSGSDDFDIVPTLLAIDIPRILWINHNEKVSSDNVVEKYMIGENGRSKLLRKQVEAGKPVVLYDTKTSVFMSDIGGVKDVCFCKPHPIDISFTEHISKWASQLTADEKCYLLGRIYQSMDFYGRAIDLFEKIPYDSLYYVKSQQQKSFCLDQMGKYGEALDVLESLSKDDDFENREEYIDVIGGIAYLKFRMSNTNNESERLFIDVLCKAGKNTSIKQTAMNNYALYLRDNGRITEAMSYFKKSYCLARKQGDLQRQTWSICNIANLLFDQGKVAKAETMASEGIRYSEMLGDHRQVGVFENLLANIAFIRGDYDAAIYYCQNSIKRDGFLGNMADSSVNELLIGQCYLDMDMYQLAMSHFDEALELFDIADDKSYLYELMFYRIVCCLKMLNGILAKREQKKFKESVDNLRENSIEHAFYNIANKLVDFSSSVSVQSFDNDLSCFIKDARKDEVIYFVNLVWYLVWLGVPISLIGKKNINKAWKVYFQIGNQLRFKQLKSIL